MSAAGLLFMLTSWGVIVALNAFCIVVLLGAERAPEKSRTAADKKSVTR